MIGYAKIGLTIVLMGAVVLGASHVSSTLVAGVAGLVFLVGWANGLLDEIFISG